MTNNFVKSVAAGLSLLAFASACAKDVAKESAHKCAGKNSCSASTATEKATKHSCGSNGCAANKCSSK